MKPQSINWTNSLVFLSGLFSAIPFTFFIESLYSGYLSFALLLLVYGIKQIRTTRLVFYLLYVTCLLLSLFHVTYNYSILNLVTPIVIPLFFIFSDYRIDYEPFYRGALFGAIVVLVSLVLLAVERGFITNFISMMTTQRNWGAENLFFGNGTALILSMISFYLLLKRQYLFSFLISSLSIITTSRIPLFVITFSMFFVLFDKRISKAVRVLFFIILLFLVSYLITSFVVDDSLRERLLKSEDREAIFNYSYNLFKDKILSGFGPIDIPFYGHLHNSFFEVLFRYGIVTFVFYIMVVFYKNIILNYENLLLLILTIALGFTQINLHNVNYVLLFCVNLSYIKYQLGVSNSSKNNNKRIL